ncbi:MAG: DUF503 domain-containing protein [Acidimicrobiales bacterium]
MREAGWSYACVLTMDLRLPEARSLKAKRAVVKHLVESARSRFGVAAAEVGSQDNWQRTQVGFAAISGSERQVEQVLDGVDRFVWSHPEVEVVSAVRSWLETER